MWGGGARGPSEIVRTSSIPTGSTSDIRNSADDASNPTLAARSVVSSPMILPSPINWRSVRRAAGATRKDIILMFLIEAVMVSFFLGILGIILGFALSYEIESTSIEPVVLPAAIALSFLVSVSVGFIFGLLSAKRAAERDPVVPLHHEWAPCVLAANVRDERTP